MAVGAEAIPYVSFPRNRESTAAAGCPWAMVGFVVTLAFIRTRHQPSLRRASNRRMERRIRFSTSRMKKGLWAILSSQEGLIL